MVDKEMVSAISDLLDEKLVGLKDDVKGLKADVSELKKDVRNLEGRVDNLYEQMGEMRSDIDEMKSDIGGMKSDIDQMKSDMDGMKSDIKKLQVTQENEILPVLRDLSKCYVDTYDRYRQGIEEHEEMKGDISVLKTVVAEHSVILQRIS